MPDAFVRTVLGDIAPGELGVTYAHEHIVIDGGGLPRVSPDFQLSDADRAVTELAAARELGLRAVVDALPCAVGRNVGLLATIARRAGVHVVAATGLHLARYYDERHWSHRATVDELVALFEADISDGIDDGDYSGPLVHRTEHRAGVIKVAGSADGLTERERRVYEAAAIVQRRTGAPILAHCTDGRDALGQVRVLADHGADVRHVVLSHTDKVVDHGYHREILASGVRQEFDQAFRSPPGAEAGTLTLLGWLFEDGRGDQLLLGMDAARQGYWSSYGGNPGMTYLLGPFADAMRSRGLGDEAQEALFVTNPARAFAFVDRAEHA